MTLGSCLALLLACSRDPAAAPTDGVALRLSRMSLNQRAAQTVAALVPAGGGVAAERLRAEIATGAAGALLIRGGVEGGGAPQLDSLRLLAPWPLLVVVEGPSREEIPTAAVFTDSGSSHHHEQIGRLWGLAALEMGADLVVAGLPRINREEPLRLPRAVSAERASLGMVPFLDGMRSAGVGVAVGALEAADSMREPLRWDRARLEAIELRALENAVQAGVGAIRLGAVRLPALTGDSLPLPMSPTGPSGLLRRDLGFAGVAMADISPGSPLLSGAGEGAAAVELLRAGIDLLLGAQSPAAIVDALVAAVEEGRLPPQRLDEAAGRVMRLRASLQVADSLRPRRIVAARAERQRLRRRLGGAARAAPGTPAPSGAESGGVASANPGAAAGSGAIAAAGREGAALEVEAGRESVGGERAATGGEAAGEGAAGEVEVARADEGAPAAGRGAEEGGFTAPVLRVVPADSASMSAGLGATIDALMRRGLEDSVFTAAAVAVGRREGVVVLRGYGLSGRQGAGPPVDPRATIFDLASLTKVVGTTTAVALLVDQGRMELDAPVRRYLPDFAGGEKDEVQIHHLLTHTAGLPSGLWLFGSADSPQEAFRQLVDQPLLRPPGEKMEYSDLGMILLAEAAARAAEMPIDRYLAARVFAPLGMQSTMYLPPLVLHDHIVPTAELTERDFPLQGVVHDANSFRLGGIAGHAGLFSTARDLAAFAQMMLNGGRYGPHSILSAATIERFTRVQRGTEERALGWDTPSRVSSAGDYFSAESFGHTGYTGTSLWIDPTSGLFVVLLTNRTYPGASAAEILELRADVHDAAARAVTDRPVRRR